MKWHRFAVSSLVGFILIFSFCGTSCRAFYYTVGNRYTDFHLYSKEKTEQRIANFYKTGDDPLASGDFRNAWNVRHGDPIRFEILGTDWAPVLGWRTEILVERSDGLHIDHMEVTEDGLLRRFSPAVEPATEHTFSSRAVTVDSSVYPPLPESEIRELKPEDEYR